MIPMPLHLERRTCNVRLHMYCVMYSHTCPISHTSTRIRMIDDRYEYAYRLGASNTSCMTIWLYLSSITISLIHLMSHYITNRSYVWLHDYIWYTPGCCFALVLGRLFGRNWVCLYGCGCACGGGCGCVVWVSPCGSECRCEWVAGCGCECVRVFGCLGVCVQYMNYMYIWIYIYG